MSISADELYELFLDAISRCTTKILGKCDEEIEYDLFEEFWCEAISFLHDDSLMRLREAGLIDDQVVKLSQKLRADWLQLENRNCTLVEIKTQPEWRELFELGDQLQRLTERGA